MTSLFGKLITQRWRPSNSRLLAWEAFEGRLFALPFILGFLMWWAYPMGYSIYLVFQDWNLLTPPRFVGFDNVVKLVTDPKLGLSLANTAYYTFLGVPLQLLVALILALVLNTRLHGVGLYRTALYLPSITPAVASAVVWMQIFHPEFGLLNAFLANFGIGPVKWLFDPKIAKPAFILMSLWTVGPQMLIFLAGLQSVPVSLHEAAQIDGASAWKRLLFVTIPILSPVIFFNFVIGIIGSFQVFTNSFIMTRGGPQDATLFTVLYLYRNGFEYFRMGYASTIAWLLFWIIVFFTLIQFKFANRWVYSEGAPE